MKDRTEKGQKDDAKKAAHDLSKAYATYRVGEYVAFGKNVKPVTEANVQLFDELTVDGTCN